MIRVLVEPGTLVPNQSLALDDDEARHLQARRVDDGTAVVAHDGAGGTAEATARKRGKGWELVVGAVTRHTEPPALVLAVGAGDRERWLLLAEKATELGVTTLIPLETERTRAVESRLRDGAIGKAARRAREACKQSGTPWATRVAQPTPLAGLGEGWGDLAWHLADPDGPSAPAWSATAPVGWIVGPEGGFTEAERDQLRTRLGAIPVGLGPYILRFETAALAAAAVTQDRRRTAR